MFDQLSVSAIALPTRLVARGLASLPALGLALVLAFALPACGEDSDPPKKDAVQTADSSDTSSQTDTAAGTDTAGGTDAQICGGLPSCIDENNQEDLSLCPSPASEYECLSGCCVARFLCKQDSDCTDKVGTGLCASTDFTCACEEGTGECIQAQCAKDSECGTGKVCLGGGCKAPLDDASLAPKLTRPIWYARPGDQIDAAMELGLQAKDDKGQVKPGVAATWTVTGGTSVTIAAGKLVAGDVAGTTTVTATIGTKVSNVATLINLGPMPANTALRVTLIDDYTMLPLKVAGKVVAVGLADAVTPDAEQVAALADGQTVITSLQYPADLHFVVPGYQQVSILRWKPDATKKDGDLIIPLQSYHFAELEFDDKGVLQPTSKLVNGDLAIGGVNYPGEGEAALGVTALAFGSSLLSFSIDTILGPNVRRPFDPAAPTIINPEPGKPQEIPGGVTFVFGKPVVDKFVLSAPEGVRTLWTLSGRLSLAELTTQIGKIVGQVDGGLNIGQVVSILLPYLAGFSSQVAEVTFGATLSDPLKDLGMLSPVIPLLIKSEVVLGDLPKAGAGWADAVIIVAGAMMPIGEIVPLGLTAAADTPGEEEVADGKADANSELPGVQNPYLSVGPLHSGLRVGNDNHISVAAAIVAAGKGKKEAGSLILSEVGVPPQQWNTGAFLPLPEGSSYTKASRTVVIKGQLEGDFYRTTLIGTEGRQWLVYLPRGAGDVTATLPVLTGHGAVEDIGATAKRALVAVFEMRNAAQAAHFPDLFEPGGLTHLLQSVRRTAFLDAVQ
jgi:hypothetical protein